MGSSWQRGVYATTGYDIPVRPPTLAVFALQWSDDHRPRFIKDLEFLIARLAHPHDDAAAYIVCYARVSPHIPASYHEHVLVKLTIMGIAKDQSSFMSTRTRYKLRGIAAMPNEPPMAFEMRFRFCRHNRAAGLGRLVRRYPPHVYHREDPGATWN